MDIKTKIIAGTIVALSITGALFLNKEDKVTLENPQVIVWEKPTTNAEWAEDVKKEGLDVRSSEVLEEMITAHKEKLERIINQNREIFECVECVKYDFRVSFQDWTETDIDNAYTNKYNNALYEIEKLKQSIERMEKEKELRQSDKVERNNIIDKPK